MSLQLAIDTSTSRPCAAVLNDETPLSEWLGPEGLRHHETLLAGIDECVKKAKIQLSDLSYLSVGVGPGLFTGLRIGITTAKFLAETQKISCVPVSSLLALAWQAGPPQSGRLWVLSDAKSHRVYALCLKPGEFPADFSSLSGEDTASPPEELAERLQEGDLLYGEGALLYKEILKKGVLAKSENHSLLGKSIGAIGAKRYALGFTCDPAELNPTYLKTGNL